MSGLRNSTAAAAVAVLVVLTAGCTSSVVAPSAPVTDPTSALVAAKTAAAANQPSESPSSSFDLAAFDAPGIYPKDAPAPASEFVDTNYLSQNLGGVHYAVYAGANGSADLKTGAVRIDRFTAADPDGAVTTLRLHRSGALKIVAFDGAEVTVTDARGGTHKLDLTRLAFVPN